MLAIDIASTYGLMDFFDVHWTNDLWVKIATKSAGLRQLILALLILLRISCLYCEDLSL
jgi:hypothetical protein